MKAIIIAGGKGARLMPYTKDRPKCMVEINNKPILEYSLEAFKECGIKDISVVTGYCADKVKYPNLKEYCNNQYKNTNIAYGLFCAEKELVDDVIVCYGDIIFKKGILQLLINDSNDFSVIIDKDWKRLWKKRMGNPLEDAETMRVNEKDYIIELGQKPKSLEEIQGQYIGLFKISKNVVSQVKEHYHFLREKNNNSEKFNNIYMTDFIQSLIDNSFLVKAVYINGGWMEFDTIDDIKCFEDIKWF